MLLEESIREQLDSNTKRLLMAIDAKFLMHTKRGVHFWRLRNIVEDLNDLLDSGFEFVLFVTEAELCGRRLVGLRKPFKSKGEKEALRDLGAPFLTNCLLKAFSGRNRFLAPLGVRPGLEDQLQFYFEQKITPVVFGCKDEMSKWSIKVGAEASILLQRFDKVPTDIKKTLLWDTFRPLIFGSHGFKKPLSRLLFQEKGSLYGLKLLGKKEFTRGEATSP